LIDHHTGAIEMARTELEEGQNLQAKALAQQIIDDRTARSQRCDSCCSRFDQLQPGREGDRSSRPARFS
jgi:hypothetical protein